MKMTRKIIEIDEELCDGCGLCVPDCAEGSLQVIDGKAKLVADNLCDGLGACLGACPTGALKIIERDADEFDEEAVEEFLKNKKTAEKSALETCPSASLQTLTPQSPCQAANKPLARPPQGDSPSALSHWPIQIRLIPPNAPFLNNADLLIVADCAPLAYPDFHKDFIKGRIVMMGCPKFDDRDSYVQKFTEIFKTTAIKSITTTIMEVPCCGSMRGIVSEALKRSGKDIPAKEVVISAQGEILS